MVVRKKNQVNLVYLINQEKLRNEYYNSIRHITSRKTP